jgi:putative ABC transport system substrate-binding protein
LIRAIALATVLAAILPSAAAQDLNRIPRVGFIITGVPVPDPERRPANATATMFLDGMKRLGYTEGKHFVFDERYWQGKPELVPQLTRELIRGKADVIVAVGPESIDGARRTTDRIPIVMLYSSDPVLLGWVKNLNRPGGNLTGLAWDHGFDFAVKQIEIVRETLPHAKRIAYLLNLRNPALVELNKRLEQLARRSSVTLIAIGVHGPLDFETGFRRMRDEKAEALIVVTDPLTVPHRQKIMALASRNRLPTLVTADFGFPDALLVYGPETSDMPARAAGYVDRILKGAKPAELPIEQPRRYELQVDLRVAGRLGFTVPQSVLARADRVLQ